MTINELKEILSKMESRGGGDKTVYVYNPNSHTYSQVERVYYDEWDGSLIIKSL